jgi:peptidylprolyl isomerase
LVTTDVYDLLLLLCARLDGKYVVFGKVLFGMDAVYKVEAEGKQSGTPKSKVVIGDS